HLQDPCRRSGAAHRGIARAGTHTGARSPGSRDRAEGGARLTEGALYGGAPPGVTRTSRTGGASWERDLARAAWSMRACARVQDHQGPGVQDPAYHATLAPCVYSLIMREDGIFPLRQENTVCMLYAVFL